VNWLEAAVNMSNAVSLLHMGFKHHCTCSVFLLEIPVGNSTYAVRIVK